MKKRSFRSNSLVKIRLLTAFAGFLGYGAWATLVNMEHGAAASIKAGFVQGSISFVLTFAVNFMIEWLYRIFANFRYRGILSVLFASLSLIVISFTINYFATTPNILLTILPGGILGSFYVYSYLHYNVKKNLVTN
jgi:hypothetical protein